MADIFGADVVVMVLEEGFFVNSEKQRTLDFFIIEQQINMYEHGRKSSTVPSRHEVECLMQICLMLCLMPEPCPYQGQFFKAATPSSG